MYNEQTWTDGQQFNFPVDDADKEGLEFGDEVVLLTGVNSNQVNTRIYGTVVDTSRVGRLTIFVTRTVIE